MDQSSREGSDFERFLILQLINRFDPHFPSIFSDDSSIGNLAPKAIDESSEINKENTIGKPPLVPSVKRKISEILPQVAENEMPKLNPNSLSIEVLERIVRSELLAQNVTILPSDQRASILSPLSTGQKTSNSVRNASPNSLGIAAALALLARNNVLPFRDHQDVNEPTDGIPTNWNFLPATHTGATN